MGRWGDGGDVYFKNNKNQKYFNAYYLFTPVNRTEEKKHEQVVEISKEEVRKRISLGTSYVR